MAVSIQGNAGRGSVVTALRPGSRVDAATIIDLDRCSFLVDHTVHGSVLLPTALQIELVVAAVSARLGSRVGLALTDIAVQDPVLLVGGAPREVRVVGVLPSAGAPGRFAVRGEGARHLGLHAAPMADRAIARRVPRGGPLPDLPAPGDLVYPPLFHGPAFQVIDRFGRRGDGLVSRLADRLPPWDLLESGGGRVAPLVELLLQTCGVWELAQTGRMMRPSRIGRLEVSPRATEPSLASGGSGASGPSSGAWAEVWPAPATPGAFDAVVRDGFDRVLIRLQGYRPVELGPPQPGVVRALASHLGPLPSATPSPVSPTPVSRAPRSTR